MLYYTHFLVETSVETIIDQHGVIGITGVVTTSLPVPILLQMVTPSQLPVAHVDKAKPFNFHVTDVQNNQSSQTFNHYQIFDFIVNLL